jgi:hypothetical protein
MNGHTVIKKNNHFAGATCKITVNGHLLSNCNKTTYMPAGLTNGTPNGTPNGMANGMSNGMANGSPPGHLWQEPFKSAT